METVFKKIDWILSKIENAVMLISILTMLVVLFAQIIMRYFFNTPLIWSEEVARYLFVYLTFIGISFGIRHGTHIRMEFFINKLPEHAKQILDIITTFFSAAMFIYLAPQCKQFLESQIYVHATATKIPMHIVFMALPIGLIMAAIRLIIKGLDEIRELRLEGAGK